MDLMNEAMNRRKANGLEVVIKIVDPSQKSKAELSQDEVGSDLAPEPKGDDEAESADEEAAESPADDTAEDYSWVDDDDEKANPRTLNGKALLAVQQKKKGLMK